MSIVVNKTRLPVTQWQTESGSVVSISDARMRNAKSLAVSLEPIQDLHGYSNPWVGGAGVNAMPNAVAKTETQNGITISTNGDGIYRFSGTALSDAIIVFPLSVSFTIPSGNADTGTHSAFFMNTDINSPNVTFCFMNGSVQVDSWAMSPKNRVATAYNAMSNKVCDGIKFIIRSGISVSGTISPMFVAKGTPTDTPFSPYENLCPISGRSSVTAVRDGKNLFDDSIFEEIGWTTVEHDGQTYWNGKAQSLLKNSKYAYTNGGILPDGEYGIVTLSFDLYRTSGAFQVYVKYSDTNTWSNMTGNISTSGHKSCTTNVNKVCTGIGFYTTVGVSSIGFSFRNIQCEVSRTETAYEPYQGISVTLSLGQTVYGGIVDLVSGVMTVTDANIASYNGESLPSTWISDRDVYASGTTPTIGAQVVYKLATPQTIQLSPNQIEMLMRNNTVWSDAGVVTLNYARIHQ